MSKQQSFDELFPKTNIKNDFTLLNLLFYGFPKKGKTTLVSQFKSGEKEPLFLASEDGHGALSVRAKKILKWEHFIRVVDHLVREKQEVSNKVSCIALDLISELDDMCTQYVCDRENIMHLNSLDFGAGWKLQSDEFQKQIRKLLDNFVVIFIAHSSEKEIMWNGEKIKVQAPSMAKRALEFINGKVDMIGWIIPASGENKPKVTFKPSTMCIAGSRFKHMTHDFELDFNDMSKSYNTIATWFQKGPKED